jgi:conjugal transfer pilus assembly protein TraE
MNSLFHHKNMSALMFQRNVFLALSFLLAIALVITASFLFTKSERTIIVPSVIQKEFWVDSKSVSPTYLEQYGYFISQLLLSKSGHSAQAQREILLRHTDPSFVGALNIKLREEEEFLTKQGASYVFYPTEIQIDPENLEILLIGDRIIYTGGKSVSTEREGYILSFSNKNLGLQLKGITSKDTK